jgi:hypothetical protein
MYRNLSRLSIEIQASASLTVKFNCFITNEIIWYKRCKEMQISQSDKIKRHLHISDISHTNFILVIGNLLLCHLIKAVDDVRWQGNHAGQLF